MRKIVGVVLALLFVSAGEAMAFTFSFTDFLHQCTDPSAGGCNFIVDTSGNIVTSGTVTGAFPSYTGAQIQALQAVTTGQMVLISNPTKFNSGSMGVCVSTGNTAVNQFIAVSSLTAVTACF